MGQRLGFWISQIVQEVIMKWNVEILIVVAIFVTLIWGYNMKTDTQQLDRNKQIPTLNYVGAINGKHLFEMAFTRQDNILSGTGKHLWKRKQDSWNHWPWGYISFDRIRRRQGSRSIRRSNHAGRKNEGDLVNTRRRKMVSFLPGKDPRITINLRVGEVAV